MRLSCSRNMFSMIHDNRKFTKHTVYCLHKGKIEGAQYRLKLL